MTVPDISNYKFIHAILYIMDNSTGGPAGSHWYCSAPCPVVFLKNDAATFNITQYDPSGAGFKIRITYINNTSLNVTRDSFNNGNTAWDSSRINFYLFGLK